MPGLPRRESEICVPGWGASGFLSMEMPSVSSWDTHWSWERANSASTARGGVRPLALMRRLSPNCYAYQGKISLRPPQGDGCRSCAPTWPPLHRYGWRCYLATFCLATTTLTSPCRSVSWFVPWWCRWVCIWLSWSLTPFINLQVLHPWDTLWTRRSPIGPWGFPL